MSGGVSFGTCNGLAQDLVPDLALQTRVHMRNEVFANEGEGRRDPDVFFLGLPKRFEKNCTVYHTWRIRETTKVGIPVLLDLRCNVRQYGLVYGNVGIKCRRDVPDCAGPVRRE